MQRMTGYVSRYTIFLLLALPFAGWAEEHLEYNEGLYPPLAMALENDRVVAVTEEWAQGKMLIRRFTLNADGLDDVEETLDIIESHLKDQPRKLDDWYEEFKKNFDPACVHEWKVIEKKRSTMIFERHVASCPIHSEQHTLFRVLYGKQHVFILKAAKKPDMDEQTRKQWLALLRSAKLKG